MMYGRALGCAAVLLFGPCVAPADPEPGDRHLDQKARVLDLVFPIDVATKPYFLKVVLRYGDTDNQLVVIVYPGGRSEMIRYTLSDVREGALSQLISKMVEERPSVTDKEIAAKLKVDAVRLPIDIDALQGALDDLKSVRISPVLAHRISLDAVAEYEYWYDTWQESVHYVLRGPGNTAPQDELMQWMIRFRANAPKLAIPSSVPTVPTGSGTRRRKPRRRWPRRR